MGRITHLAAAVYSPLPELVRLLEAINMFTDRELQLILNSVHGRGVLLLDIATQISQKHYRNSKGEKATKEDVDELFNGHKEHLDLVEKIRSIRETA